MIFLGPWFPASSWMPIPSSKITGESWLLGDDLLAQPWTGWDSSVVTQGRTGGFRVYHTARGKQGAAIKYLLKLFAKHISKHEHLSRMHKDLSKGYIVLIPLIRSSGIGAVTEQQQQQKDSGSRGWGWCTGAVWGDIRRERTVLYLDGAGGYITKCICLSFWFIRFEVGPENLHFKQVPRRSIWGTCF